MCIGLLHYGTLNLLILTEPAKLRYIQSAISEGHSIYLNFTASFCCTVCVLVGGLQVYQK
jgi:hypothetical protein